MRSALVLTLLGAGAAWAASSPLAGAASAFAASFFSTVSSMGASPSGLAVVVLPNVPRRPPKAPPGLAAAAAPGARPWPKRLRLGASSWVPSAPAGASVVVVVDAPPRYRPRNPGARCSGAAAGAAGAAVVAAGAGRRDTAPAGRVR